MPRVKRGNKRRLRRKKILSYAKGYFLTKHNCYRIAKLQVDRSLLYAYRDRRQKKRQFRRLWIVRIQAAARLNDISYSRFINGLNRAGVAIDRRVLADLAVHQPAAFAQLAQQARAALA
ncbi:MAG: 50S ribosomal protein L20 [Acidobacteriota bacterium]